MQWPNLLIKLSPERVQSILREGQCKPVSDYNKTPNMPSDHHDSPPGQFAADGHDESSSIGDSSLLAPPMSRRQPHDHSSPPPDPHEQLSILDVLPTFHDPPASFAATLSPGSAAASLGPMRAFTHADHADAVALPNPHPLSPHLTWLHEHESPPNAVPPQRPLVYLDGYAPAESLPPQNYISPGAARPVPSSSLSAPFFPPGSGGPFLTSQARGATPPNLGPTAIVPPNSEHAIFPRFTFAPPGADVPADPVPSATTASPTSARSWRDKGKSKHDKTSQQLAQEGSGRRRSNSWNVVSSVFRRRSGRQSGPAPLTPATDAPPELTASDWRDLAQWAYRPTDSIWEEQHFAVSVEPEPSSSLYDRSLPPLPSHLSHLPAPSAPLLRPSSSMVALNPFFLHRSVGLPTLSWDLRTGARAIFFPISGPGASAVPMAPSDYAQPATWPPCGALRIGAVGGHTGWRWPVEARNPAGVRCGDVFRALVSNLHEFVRAQELAEMPPEHVAMVRAAYAARASVGSPADTTADGIRRVDCLLGYTLFHGLEPGPSAGEWTMFVGAL